MAMADGGCGRGFSGSLGQGTDDWKALRLLGKMEKLLSKSASCGY